MKSKLKFIFTVLVSMLTHGPAFAQNWSVDNVAQTPALTSSAFDSAVAVDPDTGFVSLKTEGPSVSMIAEPNSVSVNGTTTVSWISSGFGNNFSCTRSSNPTLSGWSGMSAFNSGAVSLTVPGTAQTLTITLVCTGEFGTAAANATVNVTSGLVSAKQNCGDASRTNDNCEGVVPAGAGWSINGFVQPTRLSTNANESAVAVDPLTGATAIKTTPPPPPTPTLSLSAFSPVSGGASTTVTWSSTNFIGTVNCTRTSNPSLSGWSGTSQLASGSLNVLMPTQQQIVTLTLNCTADNGSASSSTNVEVQPPLPNCTNRPPAVFGSPRTLVSRTFSSIWNTNFPGLFNTAYGASAPGIADGTVIAYSFVAPFGNSIEGYILAVYSADSGGRGSLAAGFSECPGEINAVTPTCTGSLGKIRNEWTTNGRNGACNLVPGRTYYYNLSIENSCVFGPEPGTPGAVCSFRLESKRYF